MIDVERILRIAVKRKGLGLVGMVLSVDQVIALVARGDGMTSAYEARIRELEREIGRLQEHTQRAAVREEYSQGIESRRYQTTDEIAESCGVARSTACRWASEGWVAAEKRKVMGPDGIPRDTWYIDAEEARMLADLSRESRNAIGRGAVTLADAVMAEMELEEEVLGERV